MAQHDLTLVKKTEFYDGESPVNYEQKCPLVLLVDVSSSMAGDPIEELNKGLKMFQTQIQNDPVASARLETCIITFGSEINTIRDFSLFEGTAIPDLVASGCTLMFEGIREGISRLVSRKEWFRSQGLQYYRPYVILITDGSPYGGDTNVVQMAKEIADGVEKRAFNFLAIGVEGVNKTTLSKLSPSGKIFMLKEHNFVQLFEWLSSSIKIITNSKPGETVSIAPTKENDPFQLTV